MNSKVQVAVPTSSKSSSKKDSRETGKSHSQKDLNADNQGSSKRKRKRKRTPKSKTLSDQDHDKPKMQTNANYPKELSSLDNLSCNWKKLCQTNHVAKPSNSTKANREPNNSTGKLFFPRTDSKATSGEIWFDGVDKELLEPEPETSRKTSKPNTLVKKGSFAGLTSAVAIDCEMVGTGENGSESVLARISIVNLMGNCIYDKYVKCNDRITDYRTPISGIRPSDLEKGEEFTVVQKEVSDILNKRILVGHALHNDLKVLFLTHPRRKIRDTSIYKPFRKVCGGNTPSLKTLSQKILAVTVQDGEHNSIQDAQAAMRLYTMHKVEWEMSLKKKHHRTQVAKVKSSPKSDGTKIKKQTNSPTTRKLAQLKL